MNKDTNNKEQSESNPEITSTYELQKKPKLKNMVFGGSIKYRLGYEPDSIDDGNVDRDLIRDFHNLTTPIEINGTGLVVSKFDIEYFLGRRLRKVEEGIISKVLGDVVKDEIEKFYDIQSELKNKVDDFVRDKKSLNNTLRTKTGWKKNGKEGVMN